MWPHQSIRVSTLISFCSEINVMMDASFLASMQLQQNEAFPPQPIYTSLATILSKMPLLVELRLSVLDVTAWNAFPLVQAHGVSIHALQYALDSLAPFKLLRLKTAQLDGIEDVSPLLALAPNLENLSLSLSAGFALSVNQSLLDALELVPKLKRLAYTPDTLRVEPPMREQTHDLRSRATGTADLLVAIGERLPVLESLDLQTRWFGEVTYFCSSSEPICPAVRFSGLLMKQTPTGDIDNWSFLSIVGTCVGNGLPA